MTEQIFMVEEAPRFRRIAPRETNVNFSHALYARLPYHVSVLSGKDLRYVIINRGQRKPQG